MAISNTVRDRLNKMCITAQDSTLGTVIQQAQTDITALQANATKSASIGVVAADQTAGYKTINTGVTIHGFIVQVYRSGILLGSYKVTATTTNLKVETNGSDYVVTVGDIINYVVW